MQSPILSLPPPEGGKRYVELASPKVGAPVSGLILSTQIVGYNTHFIHGRTHPCLGEAPQCIGHAEGAPVRWKGYLFGISDQTGKPVLFEIPAQTVRDSLILRDGNLAGRRIRLVRVGPNVNSMVTVQVMDGRPTDKGSVPGDEPDILKWLSVIWGIADPGEAIYATEGGRNG